MKITVSDEAKKWFVEELELELPASIRFFGKYGGSTNVHNGFTTGMEISQHGGRTLALIEADDLVFYINENDDWFFHGYDLMVDYDSSKNEPTYFYQAQD